MTNTLASAVPAASAPRPTFAVTLRTNDGTACIMIAARSESDALRRAVKAGHNVQSVRRANVRAADAPRPVVKVTAGKAAPAAVVAPRATVTRRPALSPEQRAADAAFDREFAALLAEEARENAARAERVYWLTGEGKRPALAAAPAEHVPGTPRHQITARNRPGVGAPFVGEASLVGTGRHVRAAHEYVPVRDVAPVWAPRAASL